MKHLNPANVLSDPLLNSMDEHTGNFTPHRKKLIITIGEDSLKKNGVTAVSPLFFHHTVYHLEHAYISTANNLNPITDVATGQIRTLFLQDMVKATLENKQAFSFKLDLSDYDSITGFTGQPKVCQVVFVGQN